MDQMNSHFACLPFFFLLMMYFNVAMDSWLFPAFISQPRSLVSWRCPWRSWPLSRTPHSRDFVQSLKRFRPSRSTDWTPARYDVLFESYYNCTATHGGPMYRNTYIKSHPEVLELQDHFLCFCDTRKTFGFQWMGDQSVEFQKLIHNKRFKILWSGINKG